MQRLGVISLFSFCLFTANPGWATETQQDKLPLEEIRLFVDVYSQIKSSYVEEVDDKTLIQYAIKGMLEGLDPHSSYLEPKDFSALQEGTSGEFGGLGIEVNMDDGRLTVVSPIDDTPASRAGIQAGDVVIKLDEKPIKGMTLMQAVDHMRGKPGTAITLTIIRKGSDQPLELQLTRAVIQVTSVKGQLLEQGIGYLRISQFQNRTGENLLDTIARLKKENSGELRGLVLDLRNNPGGVLNAAVSVSDAFLSEGLIVYTEGRRQEAQMRFNASQHDVLKGAPMVVLVNGGSASASEIVAGALQDHKRAVIMGNPTFGKGSVQTILPVREKTAVKLTTARYFTPAGRSIQALGIEPDIVVEPLKLVAREQNPIGVKEKDLNNHLLNGDTEHNGDTDKTNGKAVSAEKDYVLFEAVNLLKGLGILKPVKSG